MTRRGAGERGTPDRSRPLSVRRGSAERSAPDPSLAPLVRRGTEGDVPALARMLGRAFRDDPVVVWACRSGALRPTVLAAINDARLRQLLAHEEVWVAADATSAALWTPPGQGQTGLLRSAAMARGLLRPRLAACLPRLAIGLACMQRQHPRDPRHWYLARLATDPDAQGRGLGSAVLQPVLERCDSEGVGAHLETAVERNLDFYARHGFRVSGDLRLPRGPTIWSMWREPRPRR
jgi:GNAT superfamily N-acetyltransferase